MYLAHRYNIPLEGIKKRVYKLNEKLLVFL
jgi:hypothetical protein